MSKSSKAKKYNKKKSQQEWPLVVYLWIVGLGFTGYLVARIALDAYPHPIHWISGILSGVLGCLVGWLWYRWRGDVI